MNKETYRILKEINSLYQEQLKLKELITTEEQRLNKMEQQRAQRADELTKDKAEFKELNQKIQLTENALAHNQSRLDQANSHINSLFTQKEIDSHQAQIDHLKSEIEIAEEAAFLQLEKLEELELHITEAENFLSGSSETLAELKQDIDHINTSRLKQVENLSSRIDLLLEQVPVLLKNKYLFLVEKNLPYGPVAQINQDACSICRMGLSKQEIDLVEKQMQLKSCPSCGRILIPISSLY